MVTAAELRRIDQMLQWHLVGWLGHPDYEDVLQEARIAAWWAVEAHRPNAAFQTLVARAIHWAAQEFRRGHMCRCRGQVRAGRTPPPEWVSLEAFAASEESPRPHPDFCPDALRDPDFAPGLLERLALARAQARLAPEDREVLHLYYEEGLTLKAIGKRNGYSEGRAHQRRDRALVHLRRQMEA